MIISFMIITRYDDLKRLRWDVGYFEDHGTFLRFFLEKRKTDQNYGGVWLDIPFNPPCVNSFGFRPLCLLARCMSALVGLARFCVESLKRAFLALTLTSPSSRGRMNLRVLLGGCRARTLLPYCALISFQTAVYRQRERPCSLDTRRLLVARPSWFVSKCRRL